jgi:hypothetical protein
VGSAASDTHSTHGAPRVQSPAVHANTQARARPGPLESVEVPLLPAAPPGPLLEPPPLPLPLPAAALLKHAAALPPAGTGAPPPQRASVRSKSGAAWPCAASRTAGGGMGPESPEAVV